MDRAPTGTRVLVVDDDPGIAGVLQYLLTDEGYQVTASVGGHALPLAQAEPPDLILLDVMMPGMDGPEVCRRLQDDPRSQPSGWPAAGMPGSSASPSPSTRCLPPWNATSPASGRADAAQSGPSGGGSRSEPTQSAPEALH